MDPAVSQASDDMNLGSYLPVSAWGRANSILSADKLQAALIDNPKLLDDKVVIIGGDWHSLAWMRGDATDLHQTLVGEMNGSMISGGYVESILRKRTFTPTVDWLPETCELLFGLYAAIAFSLRESPKFKVSVLFLFSAAFIVTQWILLATFGVFFEALVPVFGLWIHSMAESGISLFRESE